MQILPTIQEENDWVMKWEMIVQSTFIWANYLLPNSPYCMIYLWWETERENWSWSLLEVKGSRDVSDYTLSIQETGTSLVIHYNVCAEVLPCGFFLFYMCEWWQESTDKILFSFYSLFQASEVFSAISPFSTNMFLSVLDSRSRVKLAEIPDDSLSTYINANFIKVLYRPGHVIWKTFVDLGQL